MRALFVVLTDNPGGAERIAVTLANRLSQVPGWHVELLIMGQRLRNSFVESTALPTVGRSYGRFGSDWLSFVALPARLIGRRYDLTFTTHTYTNALLALMKRVFAIRTRRLVARESTTVFDRFTGLKRSIFHGLYRLYGGQNLIIAQTQYMAKHVAPHMPSRAQRALRVIPNPVDLEAIEQAALEPPPVELAALLARRPSVLVCGRLIDVKQPKVAIETFVKVRQSIATTLQLIFMGDGALRADLEVEVESNALSSDVVFLGQQSNPYAIMRACEYGLLTSSREGFPNVVLEMMACGVRKVVMTPCAGDLDALRGVTVTNGFSSAELATALADAILSGEDHRQTYRANVAERSIDRYLNIVLGIETDG